MREITVNVTEIDIAKGVCEDPHKCAVALALLRDGGFDWVDVGGEDAQVRGGFGDPLEPRELWETSMPGSMCEFIEQFDLSGSNGGFVDLLEEEIQEIERGEWGDDKKRNEKSIANIRQDIQIYKNTVKPQSWTLEFEKVEFV